MNVLVGQDYSADVIWAGHLAAPFLEIEIYALKIVSWLKKAKLRGLVIKPQTWGGLTCWELPDPSYFHLLFAANSTTFKASRRAVLYTVALPHQFEKGRVMNPPFVCQPSLRLHLAGPGKFLLTGPCPGVIRRAFDLFPFAANV